MDLQRSAWSGWGTRSPGRSATSCPVSGLTMAAGRWDY